MTISGFYKLRAFFTQFLVVLVLASFRNGEIDAFTVVRSVIDTFSNPDASCRPSGCGLGVPESSGCSSGDCCICKCSENTPAYLIHSKTCVANDEVADCELITSPLEMAVKDMSRAGKVQFGGEAEGCNGGLLVSQWSYRLDKPQWIIEQPNNFSVTDYGRNRNQWSLQWHIGLDAKYSGLILKFDLGCIGQSQYASARCLLIKSMGNYTLTASNSDPSLQVLPSDVAVIVTEEIEPTERREINDTEPDDFETVAQTKRKVAEKNNSVVAVGVSLSLVAGVALICVVLLRRSGTAGAKGQGKPAEPAYEEPVIPVKRDSITFHNEFYDTDCVLTIDGHTAAPTTKRLGPLPAVPSTEEGIYEEPVFIKSARPGYQGLATETRESDEQSKELDQTQEEPNIDEEPAAFYNTLEPTPDDEDDDYDDTIDYDDTADYDDVVEPGCSDA